MKNKNQKLFIVVGVLLLLVVGISLSYYVSKILINGEGANTKVTTAKLQDTTFTVEGTLEFDDLDVLPGHKNIFKIKVTAKNNNELINYNLVWNGINGLSTPLKYYVYKSESNETPSITCAKQKEIVGAHQVLYETCTNNNFDNIGEVISTGTITNSNEERKIVLKENESITSSEEGTVVYYYVVLEFPNEDNVQNRDINKKFEGEVTVELYETTICGTHNVNTVLGTLAVNDCEPNFRITSEEADTRETCMYNGNSVMAGPGGATEETCQHVFNAPGIGYFDGSLLQMLQKEDGVGTWNSETSTCTYNGNNVTLPDGNAPTEEQCKKSVYTADSNYVAGIEEVGSGQWIKGIVGKTGIYEAADGMYGGTSYYYRGAVENNYLTFANYCWRIVRINGDGTLRLIYDGKTCHINGINTADRLPILTSYSSDRNRSEYVGWTYKEGYQRPSYTTEVEEVDSGVKRTMEIWYNSDEVLWHGYYGIKSIYRDKVVDGKFCNDRNTASGYSWNSQPSSTFYYAGSERLDSNQTPTLSCSREDVYTLKVGAITIDEIVFAGAIGGNASNKSYYLYSGYDYWTITPSSYSNSNGGYSFIYELDEEGKIKGLSASSSSGIRPVINLKSDITFSGGDGTIGNPYIVAD